MSKDAWNPTQYEKFKNLRSQPFYDLMELLVPKPNLEIVDLGCGTGELTSALHKHMQAKETKGIDSSEAMLEKSKEIKAPGLSFEMGAMEKFTSPKPLDIIFSNAALHQCSNHSELFENLKKNLKPGGQLAIQMPMSHDYPSHTLAAQMFYEEPWRSLLKDQNFERGENMLSVQDYASLLFKLGFKEQKVFLKVYGHVLDSSVGVLEWVKGSMLTHFRSRLSPTDYENFLKLYEERLLKLLPDDKPFFYPFKRVLMWAQI